MAELVGILASGITIAGLLRAGLDAFDLIQIARDQGADYEKLALFLTLERARLYTWGQAMGLTQGSEDKAAVDLLACSSLEPLVRSTLDMIVRIFRNGDMMQTKYGCAIFSESKSRKHPRSEEESIDTTSSAEHLAASFSHFKVHRTLKSSPMVILTKTKWIIKDRQKFERLIQEVRQLIDGLQDITRGISNASRQENIIRCIIQEIKDQRTLHFISEACIDDYPNISEAATARLDVMSLATDQKDVISAWAAAIDEELNLGTEDLENLTVTELKDLLHLERRNRTRTLTTVRAKLEERSFNEMVERLGFFQCSPCKLRHKRCGSECLRSAAWHYEGPGLREEVEWHEDGAEPAFYLNALGEWMTRRRQRKEMRYGKRDLTARSLLTEFDDLLKVQI